jgi:hypothetical protein
MAEDPRVSLARGSLADDWAQLWWARADGDATIERSGEEHAAHWALLRSTYPQYDGQVLDGPVIVVTVESWSGWAFRSAGARKCCALRGESRRGAPDVYLTVAGGCRPAHAVEVSLRVLLAELNGGLRERWLEKQIAHDVAATLYRSDQTGE